MLTINDLHQYQKRSIAKAIRIKYGYLFLGTGMGKTVMSLIIHDQLKKRGLVQRSLVIAPKFVMNNVWMQEAKVWDFSKDFEFAKIHGSTTKGSAEYSRYFNLVKEADFYLINYEGLIWLSNALLKHPGHIKFNCIFYDESTRIRNPGTKRFKAFKQFMRMAEYRYCLTGTPMPKGLEDIFGQAYVVDQGKTLGRAITHFRNNYMRPLYTLPGTRKIIYGEREGAIKEVSKKLSNRVIRLKKTDHLKLPEVKYHTVKLQLTDALESMYRQLENDFFLEVGGAEIEAFTATAASMKLRQFLQGKVYSVNGDATRIHKKKISALKKIELDGNTIVAYNFKFERDDIRTVARNSPFLDSRTTEKEAEKWIIEWNNYQHKFFLVNPASAAFGLNLQAGGNNIIWYSLTYDAEHYSQLIDRLWRQGQRKTVNVYHIVFENTIDEVVAETLSRKECNQEELLNSISEYIKGRR